MEDPNNLLEKNKIDTCMQLKQQGSLRYKNALTSTHIKNLQ